MAAVKPLKLRREKVQSFRPRASSNPIARVLVDHQIVHLEQVYDYEVPELFDATASIGALVEVEFGHILTQGVILERRETSESAGNLKEILKVLSIEPYVLPDQLANIDTAAALYGAKPWDFLRRCVPPFSKVGERNFRSNPTLPEGKVISNISLPESLLAILQGSTRLTCAIELPPSAPYWNLVAAIALERSHNASVLVLLPNEREMSLLETAFHEFGCPLIVIASTAGKSDRYQNYLKSRSATPVIVLGTRSSVLHSLSPEATVLVVDDMDESHYERHSPTWNTRDLIKLREDDLSVIYLSTSIGLETARRVSHHSLPLYRFPASQPPRFHSASSPQGSDYFSIIREGLTKGAVLVSVGATGYVTSFSCQKCRNIALCSCGGKLYFPARGVTPRCATCDTEYIEWCCPWCRESKPRIVKSGVIRRAEEFGRAFPRYSILTSSASNPIAQLPEGVHLVLSTPGVEPRGEYAAIIFLDLEGRLLRTTLRATEELRLHICRSLSMLRHGEDAYFALPPSDPFLQSILRGKPLGAAEREVDERDGVHLPPNYCALLVSGERVENVKVLLANVSQIELLGPFLREGKKTILVKAPLESQLEIVRLLSHVNRVNSMRKEPLLSYQINPYSLN